MLTSAVVASLAEFVADERLAFATKSRAMKYLRDLVDWHSKAKAEKEAAGE